MKIGLCGTMSVGKTTLVNALKETKQCKDYMFRKRKRGLACKHIKQMQSKKFDFLIS